MKALFWAALTTGLMSWAAAKGPTPAKTPDKLATLLKQTQDAWKKIERYEAKFTQTIESKALQSKDETKGLVYVVKPDKLRWETDTGTIQILNGKKMRSIQKNARRGKNVVTEYSDYTKYVDRRFLDLLAGSLVLSEHYEIKLLREDSEIAELRLVAKRGKETFVAEITKDRYLLRQLKTQNELEATTTRFSDWKLNSEIALNLFDYKIGSNDILIKE